MAEAEEGTTAEMNSNAELWIAAIIAIGYLALWIWTLIKAGNNGQWGWLFAVFLFSPLLLVIYLLFGLPRAEDQNSSRKPPD
jgi:hypothetical protein